MSSDSPIQCSFFCVTWLSSWLVGLMGIENIRELRRTTSNSVDVLWYGKEMGSDLEQLLISMYKYSHMEWFQAACGLQNSASGSYEQV